MPAIRQEPTKLKGEIQQFTTHKADGWGTGVLLTGQRRATGSDVARDRPSSTQDETDTVIISGKLLGARVGDAVELEGAFTYSEKWGRQFKIKSCNVVRPDGPDGAVRWMASRLPAIGETRARALVERFGEQLWEVLEHEPHRCAEVDGITAERALEIGAAYKEIAGERVNMVKLRGWGLTDNQVGRCVERWGSLDRVTKELTQNPYLLAQEVFGFGFKRSDEIAMKMGVLKNAPERLRAGVEHVVGEAAQEGHVFVAGRALQRIAAELLGVSEAALAPAIKEVAREGRLVRRGWRVYLRRLDDAEERVALALSRMLAAGATLGDVETDTGAAA